MRLRDHSCSSTCQTCGCPRRRHRSTRFANVAQDEFNPILDELFIKYAVNMYVGPEMRLTMAVATLVYTVHAANSGNVQVARAMAEMSKPAPQDPSGL